MLCIYANYQAQAQSEIRVTPSTNTKLPLVLTKTGATTAISTAIAPLNTAINLRPTTTTVDSKIATSLATSKAYTDLQISNTAIAYKAADAIVGNNANAYADAKDAINLKNAKVYTDTSLLTIPELILLPEDGCKLVKNTDGTYSIKAQVVWDAVNNKAIKNPKY